MNLICSRMYLFNKISSFGVKSFVLFYFIKFLISNRIIQLYRQYREQYLNVMPLKSIF